jgi:hypothetical protein
MSLPNRSYTIEFSSHLRKGSSRFRLATDRLILDGVRRIEYWSLILRGIGRLDRSLEAVPGAEMKSYSLELTDDVKPHPFVFSPRRRRWRSVCARRLLSNFITCRTLWGLLTVSLLRDAESDRIDEKRAAEIERVTSSKDS